MLIAAGAFLTDADRFPWKGQSEFCIVRATHYFKSLGFVCSPSFFSLPAACRLFSRGWFSRAPAFRSLYYPWGKMGTTRSLACQRAPAFLKLNLQTCGSKPKSITTKVITFTRRETLTHWLRRMPGNLYGDRPKTRQAWRIKFQYCGLERRHN